MATNRNLNVSDLYSKTVLGLRRTNPPLSAGLVKWKVKLFNGLHRLNKATKIAKEDAFQEIVYFLIQMDKDYDKELYSCGEKLFTFHSRCGNKVSLISHDRANSLVVKDISEVYLVDKVSYNSMVFKVISQTLINMYRYSKCSKRKSYGEVSLQDNVDDDNDNTLESITPNMLYTPEEQYEYSEFLARVNGNLSEPAKKVFRAMFEEPLVTPQSLVAPLHMRLNKASQAKKELKRVVKSIKGITRKSPKKPIHFKASVVL